MNASQFMDKQIMDLANSPNGSDFVNLINPQDDGIGSERKEEITPSYDFQPIRPAGSSLPQTNTELDNGGARVWNSADSKNNIGIRNVSSLDSIGPAKAILEKDHTSSNEVLLSAIDQTMKKYADSLLQTLEGVSSRISQLESRSRHLENAMEDLKISVGSNQGSTDGKLRQVENILREVQSSVQVVKDKQNVIENQLHFAKLQLPKTEQHPEINNTAQPDSFQHAASVPQQSYQQQLTAPPTLQPPSTPPPASQQTPPPPVQFPNQFVPNQLNPREQPYFPPQSQIQEGGNQPYQLPPPQQPQPQPAPPLPAPPQQHYQPSPHPQFSQPPPQPQPHPSVPPLNSPQSSLGHRPEEQPYPPPHNFPQSLHQSSLPTGGNSPSQQFYGAPPSHMYEPPSSRVNSGFPSAYGPSSGSNEPYPYGGSNQYGGPPSLSSSGSMKQQGGGNSYPQLPTARILPQGPPTASAIGGSGGGGNRVPIDDVVDKVTTMGFSRDQVRATVRKLTESGQTVDLNTVLDKLMNEGGDGQPPRGWFGR